MAADCLSELICVTNVAHLAETRFLLAILNTDDGLDLSHCFPLKLQYLMFIDRPVIDPLLLLSDGSQRADESITIDTTLLVHFFGKKGKAELTFDDFYRY